MKKDILKAASVIALAAVGIMGAGISASQAASIQNVSPGDPIDFADAEFRSCVALALGLSDTARITPLDMATLEVLPCGFGEIHNISGIEYAKHLKRFSINNNKITDLTPLAGLTKLENLDVQSNKISDISPLANLSKVTTLGLSDNSISNIDALASLTAMDSLYLNENQLTSLAALSGMTKLTHLTVNDNKIVDTSPLSGLSQLWVLEASRNQISDVAPLVDLGALKFLYVDGNKISDISAFANLDSSTVLELRLNGNNISDISPLGSLTSLPDLRLANNQINDISPLATLSSLRRLELTGNDISSIAPLAGITRLGTLRLGSNHIADISPLANLTRLSTLDLTGQQIVAADALSGDPVANPLKNVDGSAVAPRDKLFCSDTTCDTLTYPTAGSDVSIDWDTSARAGMITAQFSGSLKRNVLPPTPGPSQSLTPERTDVAVGGQQTISAAGFTPGASVTFKMEPGSIDLGSAIAQSNGVATISFSIPAGTSPGAVTVVATEGALSSSTTFNVSAVPTPEKPKFSLGFSELAPGQHGTLSVSGFIPNEPVAFVMHSDPVDLGSVNADQSGVATLTFMVPLDTPAGTHHIIVTQGETTASIGFTVSAKPVNPPVDEDTTSDTHSNTSANATAVRVAGAAGTASLVATGTEENLAALVSAAMLMLGAIILVGLSIRRNTKQS